MKNSNVEYKNMVYELNKMKDTINNLPKGAIRKRIIEGKEYYYLQYRDGKHVRSKYIKAADLENIQVDINSRKKLENDARALENRLKKYSNLIGVHSSYRPVKSVDYEEYTLFMSAVAHDYKSLNYDSFMDKYDVSKFRGLNKRYLTGFYDYINGIDNRVFRKTNDLVLDPYTYIMYFKYNQKEVLEEELKKAIPAFLCRGLLITSVQ